MIVASQPFEHPFHGVVILKERVSVSLERVSIYVDVVTYILAVSGIFDVVNMILTCTFAFLNEIVIGDEICFWILNGTVTGDETCFGI